MQKLALAKIHPFSFKASLQNYLLAQSNEWNQALAQLKVKGAAEEVHRVRVLSRRLRALAGVFKHVDGKSPIKKWQRELKATTCYFGELRSWEVSVATLKNLSKDSLFLGQNSRSSKSVRSLKALQKGFKRYAKTLRRKLISSKILKKKKTLTPLSDIVPWLASLEEASLKAAVEKEFQKRFEQITQNWQAFEAHRSLSTLHPFRISVKKWRYCLELYQLASQNRLEPKLKNLKTWQDALGEIHDWQVLQEHLKEDVLKKQLKDYPAQKSLRKTNKALRERIVQKIQEKMQTLPHEIKEILL